MPPFKKLKQQQRVLHTNKPNKPNHFQTTANATVQAPMHSVRHSFARYSAALAKIFMSKYTFHSQAAIFLRGKALLFFNQEILPYKIYSSSLNIQRSFLRNVVFLSLIVRCSLPSIIQYVFQNIRFLDKMQCVIDIFYCCQKGVMINAH